MTCKTSDIQTRAVVTTTAVHWSLQLQSTTGWGGGRQLGLRLSAVPRQPTLFPVDADRVDLGSHVEARRCTSVGNMEGNGICLN